MFRLLAIKFGFENNVVDGIAAFLGDTRDRSHGSRIQHNFMIVDERIFVHKPKDVAAREVVTDL